MRKNKKDMEMVNFMRHRALPLLAVCVLLFGSCIRDRFDAAPDAQNESVTFKISVPAPSRQGTRALAAADEYAVDNVSVLAFDKTAKTLRGCYSGRIVSGPTASGGSAATATFEVWLPKGDFDIMLVANGKQILAAKSAALVRGASQASVEAALTMDMTTVGWNATKGSTGYHGIPMWGYIKSVTVPNASTIGEIYLTRMVARVDVQLAASVTQSVFKLQNVRVYNYVEQGRLIPDTGGSFWEEVTQAKLAENTSPCLPSPYTKANSGSPDNEYLAYTVPSPYNSLTGSIYLFEAPAGTAPATDWAFVDNTCLVVGGSFEGGGTTWYRIDFAKQTDATMQTYTYLPILRNNHYIMTVSGVTAAGYGSPEEALANPPANMTVTTIPWTNPEIRILVTNEVYLLGVSQDSYEFSEDEHTASDTDNFLKVVTDWPHGWTASVWADKAGTEALTGNWLRLSTYSGTGNYPNGNPVRLILDENTSTTESRTAYVHIKAGVLNYIVEVTQAACDKILAAPGVIGYIKGTNTLTLAGSREYAGTSIATNSIFGPLSDQTVYVAYFKWGSLIALGSEGGNGSAFGSEDVICGPDGYDLGALKNNIATATTPETKWDAVQNKSNMDWPNDPADYKNGYGDPCSAYFGEGWRLPTRWDQYANKPFGTAFGNWFDSHLPNGARWYDAGAETPSGGKTPMAGAVAGGAGTDAKEPDWSMFLPAAGFRLYGGGTVGNQRYDGHYWSSTHYGDSNGYSLYFSASVSPGNPKPYAYGMAVRCVPAPPYLTAERTDAAEDARVAADGGTATFEVDTNVATGWTATVTSGSAYAKLSIGAGASATTITGLTGTANDVKLTFTENSSYTNTRSATVKFSATGAPDVVRTVTQEAKEVPIFPSYPGVLSITKDGEISMTLAKDEGYMLFFKFGSVIGFVNQDKTVNTAWDNNYIAYNPSDLKVGTFADGSTITGYGNDKQTLPAIPCYSSTDFNTLQNHNVSHNEYHNLANIKAGKGDPCRLIGMTVAEIQAMTTDTQLYAKEAALKASRKGGWRLPTDSENAFDAGLDGAGTDSYSNSSYRYYVTNGGSLSNPNMGWFPIGGENGTSSSGREFNNSPLYKLPAAGPRYTSGTVGTGQGTYGYYWASTAGSGTSGYSLSFSSSDLYPRTNDSYAVGFGVRCVRDE